MELKVGAKIAVVGAGISGISAAYYLSRKFAVTVFESAGRLGGHTNTIAVEDPELGQIGVDTGFIVLNDRSYPTLHKFFKDLEVPVRSSDMSFSVVCDKSGIVYGSNGLRSILGKPTNLFKYEYYRTLCDFPKFWRHGHKWLLENHNNNMSVAQFMEKFGYSRAFFDNFIVPMGAAIWSSPDQTIHDFPVRFFLKFFLNHGMLTFSDQPQWQTVVGGSWQYLKSFEKTFTGQINLNSPVVDIQRSMNERNINEAVLTTNDGQKFVFDHVVVATHADQALKLLSDADDFETYLLAAWNYQPNLAVLHYDESLLPDYRPARASWNYRRKLDRAGNEPLSITYYMNRLQGFNCKRAYCVTLNPEHEIDPTKIIYSTEYQHPQFSLLAEAAQAKLTALESRRSTSFCGSYFGFGFHEDGCKAGVAVATKMGVDI